MPDLPASPRFVIVGAGIHGLSTAYHLAKELRTRGTGSGWTWSSRSRSLARAPRASPAASATTTSSPR